MKRHSFNQAEVLMLGHTKQQKDAAWSRFEATVSALGYSTKVTGGNFLTHEINCSEDDFNAVLSLVSGQ